MPDTCALHHITMEGFKEDLQRGERIMEAHNNKLEAIYDLQQAHTIAIRDLEKALGNGLRKDLNDTRVCLQTLGSKIDGMYSSLDNRLVPLEAFKWFRDLATDVRDQMLKKVLKCVGFIILFLAVIHVTDRGIQEMMKLVLG